MNDSIIWTVLVLTGGLVGFAIGWMSREDKQAKDEEAHKQRMALLDDEIDKTERATWYH